ncbi:MAG: FecCD family ABC transporter permease, partial [Actinomycetaceae bacterium]
IGVVVVPILLGLAVAASCAPALSSMSLGDDVARGHGVDVGRLRLACIVAITLLCGAGTAAVGPIGFVGLVVPHIIRWLTGTDQRGIILISLLGGPVLLLLADIAGRLVVWPSELQAGIITAFIGAPVLMVLVRRTRASTL